MKALLWAVLLAAAPARADFFSSLFAPRANPLAQEAKLFSQHRYAEVIADLSAEKLQTLRGPQLAQGYLLLGESQQALGRLDRALGVYQLGVRLFPRNLELLSQLGILLHDAGLDEQAQPLFEKVLEIHPNNAAAHLGLAEIDAVLGFLDRSTGHYEKALDTLEAEPSVWRGYSEVLLRMRDAKTSALAAQKALALDPSDEQARIDLAMAQRAQGMLPEAISTLDTVLLAGPRDDVLLTRGVWLLEARRYDEAAAAARSILAKDVDDPLAHWIVARVALAAGRREEAVRELEAASRQGRRSPFVARAAAALLAQLRPAR